MRIAMVSEHASPLACLGGADAGGQNVHVAALSTELGRRGYEVTVYTRRDDRRLPDRVSLAPGVEVQHVPAGPPAPVPKDELLPFMDTFGSELLRSWRRLPPDVVHAHFWMSGLASLRPVRALRVPLVHTFHALGIVKRRHQGAKDSSPPERIEIERTLARSVDSIVATCTDEVFELTRLGANPRRIRVVPCGVDLGLFAAEGPAEPRSDGLQRIVIVTRLVERKGVGNVVSALPEIPDAELVVAGGPPPRFLSRDPEVRRLRALADELGVGERVCFRGCVARAQLPAFYRSADVVACVPWYEPFGIVPLEAMACGRPVLATAVGGLIDTVVDRVTGLHVPPRSPERIAEALQELFADAGLRASLGAAGAERARTRYGWPRVAAASSAVYRSVLSGRSAMAGVVG